MAAPACSVRYFCLGALLIFLGSVLLCALGFTIVLPHEATSHWPGVTCKVYNATYDSVRCSCDQKVTEYARCVERYPCLRVIVTYNASAALPLGPANTTHGRKQDGGVWRTGILYRNWVDSFFNTGADIAKMDECSIHECGDEEWNVKESRRFKAKWGRRGQTYQCFFDPDDNESLVLERVPTSNMVHALLWPSLSLISGSFIWLGLCFGCWRIEMEDTYPQRHTGPYGLL